MEKSLIYWICGTCMFILGLIYEESMALFVSIILYSHSLASSFANEDKQVQEESK